MGTFSIIPTFAHWAHWSHLLSVLPMYPACAWWVFGSLSPVSVVAQKYYASEVALTIWEGIAAEYGKPGIAAIFQEFTGVMNTSIPGNSDPSFTIEKICSHFMRMATSSCTLPEHLKVMILISKMPPSMTALIQLICQTNDVEKLDVDKIKRIIIMNWEQRLSTHHNNPSHQPQAARKLSAVQCSGPPPSFQQQQQ